MERASKDTLVCMCLKALVVQNTADNLVITAVKK